MIVITGKENMQNTGILISRNKDIDASWLMMISVEHYLFLANFLSLKPLQANVNEYNLLQ